MHYTELKKKEEERINNVPIVWGFSDKQIRDNAKEKNIEVTELKPIGAGGYMRPQDRHLLNEALELNKKEREEWLKNNLQQAFEYEMANHEYCISYDDVEVWIAVGLSLKNSTQEQREIYNKARDLYLGSVIY
jgi:hypothetical protein